MQKNGIRFSWLSMTLLCLSFSTVISGAVIGHTGKHSIRNRYELVPII